MAASSKIPRGKGRHKAISLFTGAGGLDIGLERTGRFETIACVETVPAFAETLRRNRDAGRLGTKRTRIYEADIRELDPHQVLADCGLRPGDLDVLVGGPPCQSFSTTGKRGTLNDPRGMLLWDYLRFVEAMRPKYFLMENVRGLLSAAVNHRPIALRPDKGGPPLGPDEQPGSVIDLWVADMAERLGGEYRVDCFEVNAANYGAPQIRERVLFIGNRLGRVVDFPAPRHGTEEGLLPFHTLGQALDAVEGDDGEVMDFSPRKKGFLDQVPEGSNWRSLPEEVQRESMGRAFHAKGGRSGWWRRLTRDLPCPTVTTMPNHASTSLCHPTLTRALTVAECASVQEFPPGWDFAGTTQEKYAQVGNAIPTRLGDVAGEVLARELDSRRRADEDAPPYRRVYLKSHLRTRQWYRDGETFTWDDGGDNAHAKYSAKGRSTRTRATG
jgi:DNA (cytosine-5)-methyltransferase 1